MRLLLCDIGNSFAHFYKDKKVYKEEINDALEKYKELKLFYICVNSAAQKRVKNYKNWVDISPYVDIDTDYKGMGIDRKVLCKEVYDGVAIDAGSAITVDVMQKGRHLGGFIMPGFRAVRSAFASISPVLDVEFDFSVDIDVLPQNTKDALSFAALKSVILMIKDTAGSRRLFFTGGDGRVLSSFFQNAVYDEALIFKGMMKIIEENRLAKEI
ncbi:type III pantothenate kinase [Nitrosophilus alvini]|uniref:type III pantothenate kinase n=1 Tax=Nitrosophilus alvini TaxID=2714855 RepID=UPI00190E5D41|nr:type III pantothenate kinase [Nitrosophilus alvini]